jgi:rod shape-determining protein MreD
MSLTLAAVGAVVAALLDTTIAPYLRIGGVQPDLALVFAIIWTVVAGFEGGLVWAFVGGLLIDLLASRPLGSTVFTFLLVVGGAAVLARSLPRGRYLRPIVAVFVFGLVNSIVFSFVYGALRRPIPVADPVPTWIATAAYDAAIAAVIGPLAVAIRSRRVEHDRIDW